MPRDRIKHARDCAGSPLCGADSPHTTHDTRHVQCPACRMWLTARAELEGGVYA